MYFNLLGVIDVLQTAAHADHTQARHLNGRQRVHHTVDTNITSPKPHGELPNNASARLAHVVMFLMRPADSGAQARG